MRFQRILVPVDFSPQSTEAAIIALQIANRQGSTVRVLHMDSFPGAATVAVEPVYVPPDLFGGLQADYDRRVQEGLDAIAAELDKHRAPEAGSAAEVTPEVTIETERRMGDVVAGILDEARSWGCDLIVMGSSGLSGTARLILGSVADKVSRQAPCPVLVSRAREPEQRPSQPFRKVLAGIDDPAQTGRRVARVAAAVLAPKGSLELVHVWAPPHLSVLDIGLGWRGREDFTGYVEQARAAEVERLEQFRTELGLHQASCYVASVEDGIPGTLLDRADEVQADLLVVGAHGRRDLSERLLGTVADRVLRHADIPVLLVPPEIL